MWGPGWKWGGEVVRRCYVEGDWLKVLVCNCVFVYLYLCICEEEEWEVVRCYVEGDWLKVLMEDGLYAAWWSCYCLSTWAPGTPGHCSALNHTFVQRRHTGAACIPTFCPPIWPSEISPLNVKYTISEWDLPSSTPPPVWTGSEEEVACTS